MNIFTFAIKPVWKFTSFYMRHAFKPMLYTYLLQGHLNILNCPHLGRRGGNPAAFTSCASLVLLTTSLISSVHSQVPSSLVSSPTHSPKNSWQGYCDVHILNSEKILVHSSLAFSAFIPVNHALWLLPPIILSCQLLTLFSWFSSCLPDFFPDLLLSSSSSQSHFLLKQWIWIQSAHAHHQGTSEKRLKTFLSVMNWEEGVRYQHLMGRHQGCCQRSYSLQSSLRIIPPNIPNSSVEKLC